MANKNPERRAQTRASILDAYWRLYEASPAHPVSVSAIVKEAGIHRSTFYEYFSDAGSVLAAIEDELAELFQEEALKGIDATMDPVDIVEGLYVAHGDKLSMLLSDVGDPAFARKVKDALLPIAQRVLSEDTEFEPYRIEFALAGIIAVASLWYREGQTLSPASFGMGVRNLLAAVAGTIDS